MRRRRRRLWHNAPYRRLGDALAKHRSVPPVSVPGRDIERLLSKLSGTASRCARSHQCLAATTTTFAWQPQFPV